VGLICAGTLIVIAPLIVLFVLFQRLFIDPSPSRA
jgi:ABC-type glycerol-3-phosphate transport system permease component